MRAMSETNVVETINDPLLYTTPLPYVGRYYPYGFPVDIATNSRAVLEAAQESWALYTARFDKPPLRVHVIVSEDGAGLPPDSREALTGAARAFRPVSNGRFLVDKVREKLGR